MASSILLSLLKYPPSISSSFPPSHLQAGTGPPVLAQPSGRPGNFKVTRIDNSNFPHGACCSACDQAGAVFPQRLPQPPPAAHSQLPTASPHVGPRQTKATLQLPTAPTVSKCSATNQLQTDSRSAVVTGAVLRQTGNLEDVSGTSRSSQLTVSLFESVPSPPMPLHRDISDNLPTCLNFNHFSTPRVVTTSPTLTHTEINGGAEVPGVSTSLPASTFLSPVPSGSYGSAPKHLYGLDSNHGYGPASSLADTSPILPSNSEMLPRFAQFTLSP